MEIATRSFCVGRNTKLKFEEQDILKIYRNGDFDVPAFERIKSSKIPELTGLKMEYTSNELRDNFENGRRLYEALKITPLQASDERLWVFLTHNTFKAYMQKLRPIGEKTNGRYIQEHYFVPTLGGLLRNDISLLWWMFYFTTQDENSHDRYKLTKELFSMRDYMRTLFGGLIGRATGVRHGVLEFVVNNEALFRDEKQDKIRFIIRMLNQTAGPTLISFLSKNEVGEILQNNTHRIAEIGNAAKD